MDIKEIQNLIRFVSKANVAEVNLKMKDLEIKIKTISGASPQVSMYPPQAMASQPPIAATLITPTATESSSTKEVVEESNNYITVKSPMIGTFYRSSGPGKDPFVSVGDSISSGSVLCIVEAMKLFNEIESEVSGKIVKILVDDATPVEFDQPLFLVDPS